MGALAEVQAAAGPYPTHLLEREASALVLFGAAFLGVNDSIHIRNAGMYATVVDTDEQRLAEMADLYPATWTWVVDDAYEYAARARTRSFDVVSVDCFTDQAGRCADLAPEWARIARKAVVFTTTAPIAARFRPPSGWLSVRMRRSPIASWIVMEHA